MATKNRWVVKNKSKTVGKFATREAARLFKVPRKERIFDSVNQVFVR